MPAPQLHLTFAVLSAERPDLPEAFTRAAARAPEHLRLGAILPDLPYYENAGLLTLGYALRLPALPSRWGRRIHEDGSARFVRAAIEAAAACELPPAERDALLLGFLSHVALDIELHPLVNHLAARDRARRLGALSHHHQLVEKFHSMFFHLERFGEDVVGTPQLYRELGRVLPDRAVLLPRAPRAAVDLFRDACRRAFGSSPVRLRVAVWIRNFHHLMWLVSRPVGARYSRRQRTPENRRLYYECDGFRFQDYYAAAEARLGQLARLAWAYLEAGSFDAASQERFDRAAAIDSLAWPKGSLPGLPTRQAIAERAA